MLEEFNDSTKSVAEISIQLANPDTIRDWSYGEVTKPETMNYRSFKPEKDGLFCEKIFGPYKNWECNCGKYKRQRFKGVICDRCGVEVTTSKVRRERMGHIELAIPIAHIWFFKNQPCIIGNLLGVSAKDLERVIYYEQYIVIDQGNSKFKKNQIIAEEDYNDAKKEGINFIADMGAVAVRKVLSETSLKLEELSVELSSQAEDSGSKSIKADALKRLKYVESFKNSPNKPEWMILDVLPVIPPDLRPLVQLDGGRFATSDLNEFYRRVINRNNRLKKLIDARAPDIILRNEKRMLQEAVDNLFDSDPKAKKKEKMKSLSELLKGKQGRFRTNLLGKRVDYSGRSVIVVGPELKMHECGLPKRMALELYKPFIVRKIMGEEGLANTVRHAKKIIDSEDPKVWDIIEPIIKDHPVMLNRAPTLHRLGIQAFYPKLIEGSAIRLHPLVCAAFNADFDGDQMAVHLPLSFEAQLECRVLMLSSNNILHPASGQPIAIPSQDIVLGLYYLSKPCPNVKGEGMCFGSDQEAMQAYENGVVDLNANISLRLRKGRKLCRGILDYDTKCENENGEEVLAKGGVKVEFLTLKEDSRMKTSVGRVILNQAVPNILGYADDTFSKKVIAKSVDDLYRRSGNSMTVEYLDSLKNLGYKWASKAGSSVAIAEMVIPEEKKTLLEEATKKANEIRDLYEQGAVTDGERYNQIIDLWSRTTNNVAIKQWDLLSNDKFGFNPVFMMADSGARGSREQIKQLSGMRGLMQKPTRKMGEHEVIENPITSCFREGLNSLEYFISTHGSRKGLSDTALKTADAGYLTRRLVDVAQNLVIIEEDCCEIKIVPEKVSVEHYERKKDTSEGLSDFTKRLSGYVAAKDIVNPQTKEVIAKIGDALNKETLRKIMFVDIKSIETINYEHLSKKTLGLTLEKAVHGKDGNVIASAGAVISDSKLSEIIKAGTSKPIYLVEKGITRSAAKDGDNIIQGLGERILGRFSLRDIKHPVTDALIIPKGEMIEERHIPKVLDAGIEEVAVRSVLTCNSPLGVCAKCYGRMLASGRLVDLGEAVGVLAAQSIGEPGTQLTLRTFHIGGAFSRMTVDSNKKATVDGKVLLENSDEIEYKNNNSIIEINRMAELVLIDTNGINRGRWQIPYGSVLKIKNGDTVKKGDLLFEWDPYNSPIISTASGKIQLLDFIEKTTYISEVDETTGLDTWTIINDKRGRKRASINVMQGGERAGHFFLPDGAILTVRNGDEIASGQTIAKLPRSVGKSKDITGGLPRVAELFEAREPKSPAILASIDGIVAFGVEKSSGQEMIIKSDKGEESFMVPHGKHLSVQEGDRVRRGQAIADGSVNLADVLRILGEEELQRHLVDEIQAVYRLQAVTISDKHIECIVRQMMRKVTITDPGDSRFLTSEDVSRLDLRIENSKLLDEGKKTATANSLLLGITKAALAMDSFIAAASFQETTKVLTKATIAGSKDKLVGLKENVIMGRLIPSGTGALHLRSLDVRDEDVREEPVHESSGSIAFAESDFEEIDDDLE
ncbi:MAG: DNA-directed RNA polymerase subunit beta' [Fibromonadaceae bacterium]|jgi:DNA-directed RNA polymerase subunit beta'|nr:DNA-directed RNA polymerase subunit beta' [Fibromonadaceae bacterium]